MLTVSTHPRHNYHRQFNNVLTVVVILLGSYIIIAPFMPRLLFEWKKHNDDNHGFKYQSHLTQTSAPPTVKTPVAGLPKPPNHRLLVPDMQLDAEVFDGTSANTLNKGIWRRPKTSTPDKGGNTVLVAHRFDYNGPATFYSLDKLKKGYKFALFWNGREYDYEVTETKVVEPTAIEIENDSKDPIITLYTCTPMWTAKQRLVVVGKLISDTPI